MDVHDADVSLARRR